MPSKKAIHCPHDNKLHVLPQYLYAHQNNVPGQFRFRNPDTGAQERLENFLSIDNVDSMPAVKAIAYGLALLKKHYDIDPNKPKRLVKDDQSVSVLFEAFREAREVLKPSLLKTRDWSQQCSAARRVLEIVDHTPISKMKFDPVEAAFQSLKHSQQKKGRRVLKLFWAKIIVNQNLAPGIIGNPFNPQADNAFEYSDKPALLRMDMDNEDFKLVRASIVAAHGTYRQVKQKNKDYFRDGQIIDTHWLRLAIDLSALTGLRREDIANLKFSDYDRLKGTMYTEIAKSKSMHGEEKMVSFIYNKIDHKPVIDLIEEAYKTRNIYMNGIVYISNYVIHEKPTNIPKDLTILPEGKSEEHTQVTLDHLSKQFAYYRDMNQEILDKAIAKNKEPTTFHKIRGMSIRQNKRNGVSDEDNAIGAAHTDPDVTRAHYLKAETVSPILKNTIEDFI